MPGKAIMPKCAIHGIEMRLFTPQGGASRWSCPTNIGVGQPNTNPKGYCNYTLPANGAQPQPQQALPQAQQPAGAPNGRERSIERQAVAKAACEAAAGLERLFASRDEASDWIVTTADRLARWVAAPPRPAAPEASTATAR